jgi:hypothetical protein
MDEKPVCIICLNTCLTPAVLHLECSCKYRLVHYRCMMKWWKKSPVCLMCHTYCEAPEMLSTINKMSIYGKVRRKYQFFITKKRRVLINLLDTDIIENRRLFFFIYLVGLIVCWRIIGYGYFTNKNKSQSASNVSIHILDLSIYGELK